MAIPKGIKKEVRIQKIHANFSFGEKIVKIGSVVDPEIIWLKLKKEEII